MTRRWNGYLVRALNEFASLTAGCGTMGASHRIPVRLKASIDGHKEHEPGEKKFSGTPQRRKYNRE